MKKTEQFLRLRNVCGLSVQSFELATLVSCYKLSMDAIINQAILAENIS